MAKKNETVTSTHPFYRAWVNMKTRALNRNYPEANRYSKRGIGVCTRWLDFQNFFDDMYCGYSVGLSLDRIDNDKGYCPENCRWATPKEQANNTSRNRIVTIDGVARNLSQWIDISGIKGSTVRQRFYVYKWPIEKALGITE